MMMTRFFENMGDSCYEQPEYDSDYDSEYDSDECSMNQKRKVLGPVQLASKKCSCIRCNWKGEDRECEQKWITFNQMQAHYDDQLKLKCSELQVETSASIAKMQAEHTAALKVLDEKSLLVLSQHIAFMATLPNESKAGRERREAEKKKAHQEKMSRQVRKGGGFKKRVVKETDPEVIKARRASRRKESRDIKKESEAERAKTFASEVECVVEERVVESVAVVEESVESLVVDSVAVVEEVAVVVEEVAVVVEESVAVVEEVVEPLVVESVAVVEERVVEPTLVTQQVCKPTCVHVSKEDDWQEVKSRTRQAPKPIVRTKMCDSVDSKKPCRHVNCRFAHSISELVFDDCSFGDACKNVRKQGGVYSTVYGKTCIRLHPDETKESVCARAGITIPKVVAQFSRVYMPTLAEATGIKKNDHLPLTTSSAWQKQIKIEPDATLVTRPAVVVKVQEVENKADTTTDTIRADAFAALAAPKSLDNKLLRTRMCDSVDSRNPCKHGTSCRFAHSASELVFASCLFGASCRHVKYQANGVYTIVWGKTCNRLHPGETNASICGRIGIKVDPAPVVLKPAPVVLKPTPVVLKPTPVVLKPTPVVLKPAPVVLKPAPVVLKPESIVLTQEETLLRVPKELAMQAMELAMKSGKTNIRLEII